jgi:hypothetical protein
MSPEGPPSIKDALVTSLVGDTSRLGTSLPSLIGSKRFEARVARPSDSSGKSITIPPPFYVSSPCKELLT